MTIASSRTTMQKAPEIIGALPNFPGSQNNLLPLSQLLKPLPVVIRELDIPEMPGIPIFILLKVGSITIDQYELDIPVPLPIQFEVAPHLFMTEGVYEVWYELDFAGNPAHSDSVEFTVDKTSPNNNKPGDRPVFPAEIIQHGITAEYLAANNDSVDISIGEYHDQRQGDIIHLHFGTLPQPPVLSVNVKDSNGPTLLQLSGDIIRTKGNGEKLCFYRLEDRAGNIGPISIFEQIQVHL